MLFVIVAAIAALSYAADALTQYVPFEVEHKLVNTINIDINTDSAGPVPVYLQTLADDLSKNMNLPDEMKINVSVINSDVVNAFATLGGNVVFFTGLLETLPNENTLAMVMAHEIAHIKLRHPLRALGRGVVVGLAVATISGVGSNGIIDNFIGSTGLLTALSFTRDQESAADELAVTALVAQYGHAEGTAQLFEILSDGDDDKDSRSKINMPEFLTTHPLSENRIAAIKNQLQNNNWAENGTTREIPSAILNEIQRLHEERTEKIKEKEEEKKEK